MTEMEGKSNYSKLEFKFKKRPIGITPSKDIHLLVGKTTAFDCEMVKTPSDLSDEIREKTVCLTHWELHW